MGSKGHQEGVIGMATAGSHPDHPLPRAERAVEGQLELQSWRDVAPATGQG